MTELVSCPRCGEALDVPVELLGKPVRCAACRTVFAPTANDSVPLAPRSVRGWQAPRAFAVQPNSRDSGTSNSWVWILTLVLTVLMLGLMVVCSGLIGKMVQPEMSEHTSTEGRFRIALPTPPSVLDRQEADGARVAGFVSTRPENQETFQVFSVEIPEKLRAEHPDEGKLLDEIARRQLPNLAAGTQQKAVPTEHGSYPALDVQFHQGKGIFKRVTVVRLISIKEEKRVYLLAAQGGGDQVPHLWHVRRFFTSFEPLPTAKPK